MATQDGSRRRELPEGSSGTQMGRVDHPSESIPPVVDSVLDSLLQKVVQVVQETVTQTLSQQQQQKQGEDMCSNLIKIAKMNPPAFEGSKEPGDILDWIAEMEKLFTTFRCPEEHKVAIATHYLKKSAYEWWEACKPRDHEPTWEEFREKMEGRYYPLVLRNDESMKLFRPRPKDETVDQAAKIFCRILRLNPFLAGNEMDKMVLFDTMMSEEIRKHMVYHSYEKLEEYVIEALNVEAAYGDQSNKRRKTVR